MPNGSEQAGGTAYKDCLHVTAYLLAPNPNSCSLSTTIELMPILQSDYFWHESLSD